MSMPPYDLNAVFGNVDIAKKPTKNPTPKPKAETELPEVEELIAKKEVPKVKNPVDGSQDKPNDFDPDHIDNLTLSKLKEKFDDIKDKLDNATQALSLSRDNEKVAAVWKSEIKDYDVLLKLITDRIAEKEALGNEPHPSEKGGKLTRLSEMEEIETTLDKVVHRQNKKRKTESIKRRRRTYRRKLRALEDEENDNNLADDSNVEEE
ncbi:hypothetical protein B0T24DRAFT_599968 [Lasiosphaeria ovina]|uniref:Uncharacterized protein n=1 Tax=Lasiosphaeria ovina TaxID=92902 RepID=A0AAE0JSA6_9PEZI|nr:hypothetical protein B0T24DRAFT_599968 [Lasiosphaeria ovina]